MVLGSQSLEKITEKIIYLNMKLLRQLTFVAVLSSASSCAMMFNDNQSEVSINSNPTGANIFIEGKNYGQTPAKIKLEAKNQTAVLTKEGFGSAHLQLETWAAIKNGKCLADALGTIFVVPGYSFMYSGKCSEFKEKEYFVNIQKTFNARPEPMVGAGNSPKNMIDYYYNKSVPQNVGAQ